MLGKMNLYLAGNYPNTIGGGWMNKPLAALTIIPNKEKEMNIYLAGGGNRKPPTLLDESNEGGDYP